MELVRVSKENLGTGPASSRPGASRTCRTEYLKCHDPWPARAVRFEASRSGFPAWSRSRRHVRIAAGSCHALCGENGAGKSTLGKILAGIYAAGRGSGRARRHAGAFAARAGARGRRRHGPPGARVLREPLRRRESVSRRAAHRRADSSTAREMRRRAERMLAAIGAAHRRRSRGRRTDDGPAADAADRRPSAPARA